MSLPMEKNAPSTTDRILRNSLPNDGLYKKMVELAWDGFLVHGAQGVILANSGFRRIFSIPEKDSLKGVHPHYFLLPEGVRPFFEGCRQVQGRIGPPARFETRGLKSDGVIIDLEICISLAPGAGEPVFQSFYRDISERKSRERKLLETERLASAGKIALNIAHEINNPLGGIVTYTHLLQEDISEGASREQLSDLADKILKLAHRCQIVVGSLLDFARDERCDLSEVRINPIIGETLSLLDGHLIMKDILVFQDLEPRLPTVLAIRKKLEQVFMNMIINAAEAMQGKGFLGISTSSDLQKGQVYIKISDTGPGISDEARKLLFEPFFSTKPQARGAGLGLSIAHGIIRQYKGTIEVDSLPGQGATFTITLPTAN